MSLALLGPLTAALLGAQAMPSEPQPVSVGLLLKDLGARKSATRIAAVAALADVRPVRRDVLEALLDRLSDKDERTRAATLRALEQLASADGFSEVAAGLSRPPRLIKQTRPSYPMEVVATKIEGTVLVEMLIDSQGRVVRAKVMRSVHYALDAAALQCVYQWIFEPAVKDGRPVATLAHAPVVFRWY